MKKYIILLTILFSVLSANSTEIKYINLADCEKSALGFSPALKQYAVQADAAYAGYKSSSSSLYPSLSFDASGSWVSEVPSLQVGPLSAEFGDNWGYSVGPTLNYVLFDNGGRNDISKSAYSAYESKLKQLDFAKKNVILQTRQAYFTVQQDLERMYFTNGQLKVAQKQLTDAQAAYKAGAKSNLDVYMAHKQQLRAQINISAARGALGSHLRELFRLTGNDFGINPAYPLDWRITPEKGESAPTAIIKADSLESTLKMLEGYAGIGFDADSPQLAALTDMANYYGHLADSYMSALYPTVGLNVGAYWQYPNGPIKEDIFLGKAGAALKIPLFEGGKNRKQAESKRGEARAAIYQRQDLEENLKRLFYSSQSMLFSLKIEEGLTQSIIDTGVKTAQLTYDAYKAGAVTFLEVDNANLSLLESRISLADIYIERLNRLAVMDNLGVTL